MKHFDGVVTMRAGQIVSGRSYRADQIDDTRPQQRAYSGNHIKILYVSSARSQPHADRIGGVDLAVVVAAQQVVFHRATSAAVLLLLLKVRVELIRRGQNQHDACGAVPACAEHFPRLAVPLLSERLPAAGR